MSGNQVYVKFFNHDRADGTLEIASMYMEQVPREGDYVCLPSENFVVGFRSSGRRVIRVFWRMEARALHDVEILLAREEY